MQPTDKPAATGSGEPKIKLCERGHLHMRGDENGCLRCAYEDANGVPTPPASQPTVTLDRETYDQVVGALARAARICDLEGFDEADKEMLDALDLLRAAEQK